jgi:hypothetical protein
MLARADMLARMREPPVGTLASGVDGMSLIAANP